MKIRFIIVFILAMLLILLSSMVTTYTTIRESQNSYEKELGVMKESLTDSAEFQKKIGLYKAFSEKLRTHAKAIGFMGYELYFEKMDPVTRKVMHKLTGEKQDVFKIDYNNVKRFISEIEK